MKLIDADALEEAIMMTGAVKVKDEETAYEFAAILANAPAVDAIPVEWLKKVRKDDRLTIDDVETIDLILTWWSLEQEAQDGKA